MMCPAAVASDTAGHLCSRASGSMAAVQVACACVYCSTLHADHEIASYASTVQENSTSITDVCPKSADGH